MTQSKGQLQLSDDCGPHCVNKDGIVKHCLRCHHTGPFARCAAAIYDRTQVRRSS